MAGTGTAADFSLESRIFDIQEHFFDFRIPASDRTRPALGIIHGNSRPDRTVGGEIHDITGSQMILIDHFFLE